MSKVTDYYGILSLNRILLDELNHFLELKEAELAEKLLVFLLSKSVFREIFEKIDLLNVTYAVNLLAERKSEVISNEVKKEKLKKINQFFWDYAEILEESSLELFHRFKLIGIDQWNQELFRVFESVNELLIYHIEDLLWNISKLEIFLREIDYSAKKKPFGFFSKVYWFFSPLIDKKLIYNLKKTKFYLNKKFKKVKLNSTIFFQELEKIEQLANKFKELHAFELLEPEEKSKFFTFFRLIRLWEANVRKKIFSREEILKAIREYTPPKKALHLIKHYFMELKNQLFKVSKEWKEKRDFSIKVKVQSLKEELLTLGTLVTQFRQMLLDTNPDPYIRTRLGFGEWIVGKEPRQTKELRDFIYEIERYVYFYKHLESSIELSKKKDSENKRLQIENEIEKILHSMGQPLASRSALGKKSERLLQLLEDCDELGGSLGIESKFIRKVFIRALRYDWKYQTIPENPKFINLIKIHFGLSDKSGSLAYESSILKFKEVMQQIEKWVKNNDTFKHLKEIETDISDVKEKLQEFLALTNRLMEMSEESKAHKESIENEISFQLLEYRVLFAEFFAFLKNSGVDGRMVRSQFLFADHYFEAVELMLN